MNSCADHLGNELPATYSTFEVCERVGCKAPTLLKWAREGLITPAEADGEAGSKQRRYRWSEDNIASAQALHDEGGRGELAKLAISMIPESIVGMLPAAAEHFRLKDEVMIVSERGALRVQHKMSIEETLSRLGPGPAVILR